MNLARTSWRRKLTLTLALALALLPAAAQQTPATSQSQPAASKAQAQKSKISTRDAQELLRSVDQIVKFVSEETNLPLRQPVKRELASADQVKALFRERLRDDQETQRLERSEAVLKKLGLVPRDFKLRPFFEDLMEEQVAGFYDERTRVVYLLDWVEPWEQRPVLAHELTHALQDQAIGLKKWTEAAENEEDVVEKKGKTPETEEDGFEVRTEEAAMARTALIEGQAMFVLIDYLYAPSGQSLATNPLLAAPFKVASTDSPQYPVLQSAPFYLKESLSFPYTYGLEFVQELLLKGGRAKAFAGAVRDPPRNTRDIMTPRSYFSHERVPAFHVPALKPLLGPGYERFDVGTLGQFDVQVMLEQFADGKSAKRLAPAWRGGFYYAARKLPEKEAAADPAPPAPAAGDPKEEGGKAQPPVTPESLALVYLSRWDSPESAAQFATFYAGTLLQRYRFAQGADEPAKPAAPPPVRRKWTTDAGPVFIEQRGEWVLALESFDEATAGRLADAILAGAKVLPAKP